MDEYNYFAFISYSSANKKIATWLHSKLENYNLPSDVQLASNRVLPKKIRPIFLDKTDLNLGPLENNLHSHLDESRFLIVICSPEAAKSKWVNAEIEHFISTGKEDKIIPVLVSGNVATSYPIALNKGNLAANLIKFSKKEGFIKIVASLLELKFESLWKRHEKRRKLYNRIYIIITILLSSVLTFFVYYQYQQIRERDLLDYKRKVSEEKAKKIAFEKIHAKAMDLIQNGDSMSELDPTKALMLYYHAYILENTESNFQKLINFYNNNLIITNVEKSKNLGYINLFTKTISGAFGDEEDNIYEDAEVEYSYDNVVKIGLSSRLVFQIDPKYINEFDFTGKLIRSISSENIINWDISEAAGCLIVKIDKNDLSDIQAWNFEGNNSYSLYRERSAVDRQAIDDIMPSAPYMPKLKSSSLDIYIHKYSGYAIIYNKMYMLGTQYINQKNYAVVEIDENGQNNMLAITGDVASSYQKIMSSSPDDQILIVYFKGFTSGGNDNKIIAFQPATKAFQIIYDSTGPLSKPTAFNWLSFNNYNYLLVGSSYPSVTVKCLHENKEVQLLADYIYGDVNCVDSNDEYIFATTNKGYLLMWKNDIKNWCNGKNIILAENVKATRLASEGIVEFKIDSDYIVFIDEHNAVRMCDLKQKIEFSKNRQTLQMQFNNLSIDHFTKKDSIRFGLYN